MKNLIFIISIVFICSCKQSGKTISKNEIDNFIRKYQTERFGEFKNVFICIRQRTLTSTIYILQKNDGNVPVYFVTYNEPMNKITEINNTGLKEQNVSDYFTKYQIAALINKFRYFKFCLLGVDAQGNVFINPYYPNNPAVFLRMVKTSKLKISKLEGNYIYYNHDWYLNQSQLSRIKL